MIDPLVSADAFALEMAARSSFSFCPRTNTRVQRTLQSRLPDGAARGLRGDDLQSDDVVFSITSAHRNALGCLPGTHHRQSRKNGHDTAHINHEATGGGFFAVLITVSCFDLCVAGEKAVTEWTEVRRLDAPEATQAAAADDRYIYAIANRVVAKYDRNSGKCIDRSSGEAIHLNTGFFLDGKLYCAHSNFPQKPDRSDIKVLDPDKMVLETFKDFGDSDGSLTWAVKEHGVWWCNFAFYGSENHKTYLARYDEWREVARWTYPAELVKAFGKNSASCGVWRGKQLLVTGHDERELFVLEVPDNGTVFAPRRHRFRPLYRSRFCRRSRGRRPSRNRPTQAANYLCDFGSSVIQAYGAFHRQSTTDQHFLRTLRPFACRM